MAQAVGVATGVAGRYATALFQLAVEQDALDAVSEDVSNLRAAIADSAELRAALRNPSFSREALGAAMAAVAERMGLGATTRNLLGVMAAKRRLSVLPGALEAFDALAAERRGETTADVVAAQPLSAAQTSALADALQSIAGRKVRLSTSVDPTLIGGLTIRMGSTLIDASVRSKLARLQQSMKEAGR